MSAASSSADEVEGAGAHRVAGCVGVDAGQFGLQLLGLLHVGGVAVALGVGHFAAGFILVAGAALGFGAGRLLRRPHGRAGGFDALLDEGVAEGVEGGFGHGLLRI